MKVVGLFNAGGEVMVTTWKFFLLMLYPLKVALELVPLIKSMTICSQRGQKPINDVRVRTVMFFVVVNSGMFLYNAWDSV